MSQAFDIATIVTGLIDCALPRAVVTQGPLDCELFAISSTMIRKKRPVSLIYVCFPNPLPPRASRPVLPGS